MKVHNKSYFYSWLTAYPAFGELTKEDLRTIMKEEVRPLLSKKKSPCPKNA